MENILTPEDKKYLKRVSNYLGSLGMREGLIEFEVDNGNIDFSDIRWDQITNFENNYRAEIPDGLIPIMEKVFKYIDENNLFNSADVEGLNYERISIEIDTQSKEISVKYWYSYYDRGDSEGVLYDSEEDVERFKEWVSEDFVDTEIPEDGILTLKYNGSGDSGYIESTFDENGESVPSGIEDWCYSELESNFGGWEINEGSDGEFIFNFKDSTVNLVHTMNVEESESDTLYEESFAE
jgi:hypothetical protein